MNLDNQKMDELAVNTIRMLALDMVEKAGSGHPGLPLEAAKIVYILWHYFLRHNPTNPNWVARDRFILSAGHGSALLYALLFLYGYDMDCSDILNFRQHGYKTPGHPEYPQVPGVEVSTGPLGQGFANGVGMAMGQKFLKNKYDDLDYRIFGVCSDGDLMEGISSEAASLAGHLKLGNMIYVYLDNHITIEGNTKLSFSEDVGTRFLSYNWHVVRIEGYEDEQIKEAFEEGIAETKRPTLIIARTHIGKGVVGKEDTAAVHGAPLTKEEVLSVREGIRWPLDKDYFIPQKVYAFFQKAKQKGQLLEDSWNKKKIKIDMTIPADLEQKMSGLFSGQSMATRKASGKVINVLSKEMWGLFGGSADLAPSCNTEVTGGGNFSPVDRSGKNIHFGVREHAMGGILNGLARTDGIVPFGGTFLVFSDYMRPSIRLAALMGLQVIYVFTHDSIFLGEDGPTHQPVEQLAALRAIPNLTVIRPADANEVSYAWIEALKNKKGPTALILTRQEVAILDRSKFVDASGVSKGAYVISSSIKRPKVSLFSSGSEVAVSLEVQDILRKEIAIDVINVASFELFDKMPKAYKRQLLKSNTKKVVVEAASSWGWGNLVGNDALFITQDTFGVSAPEYVIREKNGFAANQIARRIQKWLKQ